MGVANLILLAILACHGVHRASATFSFPSFDGAKPLMSALGTIQQYLGLPSMSSRVVKSAPSESHPSYASATVGYGTILKTPPYGAPRPLKRRPPPPPMRPAPRPAPPSKYHKYYPKFKPQPAATYEKLKPAMAHEYKPAKEHHHKNHHPYEYTKGEILQSSYTSAPEDSSKQSPVIVHQSVRPPIQFYQQPHVATSHQVSNVQSTKPSSSASHHFAHSHHYQQPLQLQQQQQQQPTAQAQQQKHPHHRSDNLLVDFSRPDPVFAAASMGSDWKPINTPMVGVAANRPLYQSSDRRADHVAKQVEPPPIKRQDMPLVQASKNKIHVDRSDHMIDFVDDHPSEEVVSAVVFVKKTND